MDSSNQNAIDLLSILNRRKYSILFPFLFVMIISVGLVLILPSIYVSKATFLVEEQKIIGDFSKAGIPTIVEMTIENITQQIMKQQTLLELIDQFQLFEGEITEEKTNIDFIDQLRDDINIELITTDVINPRTGLPGLATTAFIVSFQGKNPEKVFEVTKALTNYYLEYSTEKRLKNINEPSALIQNELEQQRKKVETIENQLTGFRTTYSESLPEKVPQLQRMIERLEIEITRLNSEISKVSEKKLYLKTNQNPDIKNLENLKAELAAKEAVLSSKHPDIINLKKAISNLEYDIKRGKKKVKSTVYQSQLNELNSELIRFRTAKEQTKTMLDKYQKNMDVASQIENEYLSLMRDYESERNQYETISKQLLEAKAVNLNDLKQLFTLIEPPVFPKEPEKPDKMMIILIGFGIAVGLGFICGILSELIDQSIRDEIPLSILSKKQVLAVIPEFEKLKDEDQHIDKELVVSKQIKYNHSKVAEVSNATLKKNKLYTAFSGNIITDQYGILKTRLLEKTKDKGLNTILITSAEKSEGKSTIAANLAISLSKELSHSVLLVDGDLRTPSLHKFFDLDPENGVSEYFLNNTSINHLFVNPGMNKLLLLPGHSSIENSVEVIASPKMEQLLKELKTKYPERYVIIDTTPINNFADAQILSKYVDAVILVVEAGQTTRDQILKSLDTLQNRNLIGLILNKA